jgi:hypothetical protein
LPREKPFTSHHTTSPSTRKKISLPRKLLRNIPNPPEF